MVRVCDVFETPTDQFTEMRTCHVILLHAGATSDCRISKIIKISGWGRSLQHVVNWDQAEWSQVKHYATQRSVHLFCCSIEPCYWPVLPLMSTGASRINKKMFLLAALRCGRAVQTNKSSLPTLLPLNVDTNIPGTKGPMMSPLPLPTKSQASLRHIKKEKVLSALASIFLVLTIGSICLVWLI